MQEYATTFSVKRLWTVLAVGMFVMFGVLLLMGRQIYQLAPPIPEAVTAKNGETLFTRADIETGQNVWQSIGGMSRCRSRKRSLPTPTCRASCAGAGPPGWLPRSLNSVGWTCW